MTICELEECIDTHGKAIYTFCIQLTHSLYEAEELYQNTFVKAMELSEKLDRSQNPKSYLLSVAIGLWKNNKRKFARRQRIAPTESLDTEWAEQIEDTKINTAEEQFMLEEETRLIKQTVNKLNDKYRIPILLYYMESLTAAEIGNLLKLPTGTVKSRLHKARKLLESELEVVFNEER